MNILSQKLITRRGFTIVELLIVIVVIGILAAIIIVAYSSVTQRSHVASLVSDLGTAAGQLNLDNGSNGSYPATAALANNGAGLKPSPGTTFTYVYTSSDNSYCLIGTKNGASYYVAEGIDNPVAGTACPPRVTTLAGSGTSSYADGTGAAAAFSGPMGIVIDSSGAIYIADEYNQRIRKMNSAGVVTTLAGSGTYGVADGTGVAAQFANPKGIALDSAGIIYVADNNHIRKITPSGVVTTLAGGKVGIYDAGFIDGTGTAAQFDTPYGVAVDSAGTVYVADSGNNSIRKITPGGVVTTLAGSSTRGFADGTGAAAMFNFPEGIAVDSAGTVYVSDKSAIRKITPGGVVTTLAGSSTSGFADGTGATARLMPGGIFVDSAGTIYFADVTNNRIRKITPGGVVTTLAGSGKGFADGTLNTAQFYDPYGITVDSSGTIYIGDSNNNRIRKIQ